MKIRYYFAAGLLCCAAMTQAQQLNSLTQAMLKGYEEILSENPKDYQTLYQRAAQYYELNMYDQALNDLSKALQYTPLKESVLLAQELSLVADINIQLKQYEKALEAVDKVLEITPDSYSDIYKKGNICLYLDRPEEAYKAFSSMQRLKTRSQEAYFGMAKALIMQGDISRAKELINQAEQADPSNYVTYCRIGDLYNDMGEHENAAANYLSAFSLTNTSIRPLESLIAVANSDFGAFERAVDYAVSRTSNKVPLYFLKGNISFNCGNYEKAYDSLTQLLSMADGREGSVYATLARTCLALGNIEEALTNADMAVMKSPVAQNYLTKSMVELVAGNAAASLLAANKALGLESESSEALVAAALANYALNNRDEAIGQLSEAVLINGSDAYPLMLRAYIYNQDPKTSKLAVADYMRVAQMEAEEFPAIAYKAMAQAFSGKKLDADATLSRGLSGGVSKDDFYHAAVYYAQTGNLQKAKDMIDKAVAAGYSNKFNLNLNNSANLNIAPIRYMIK